MRMQTPGRKIMAKGEGFHHSPKSGGPRFSFDKGIDQLYPGINVGNRPTASERDIKKRSRESFRVCSESAVRRLLRQHGLDYTDDCVKAEYSAKNKLIVDVSVQMANEDTLRLLRSSFGPMIREQRDQALGADRFRVDYEVRLNGNRVVSCRAA